MTLLAAIGLFAERYFSQTSHSDKLTETMTKLLFRVTQSSLDIPLPTHDIEVYPLYNTLHFTMCIFVMKKGSSMPIHDHPGMTVLRFVILFFLSYPYSKIVHGDMHVRTFHILDPAIS